MKQILFGIGAALLMVAILMNTVTIEGSGTRNRDMKNALHAALEEALLDAMSREHYDGWDDDMLLADATALLMDRLNAADKNLALSLDVAGVDSKAGLLSVRATETFTYPNGRTGEVEDVATVVLERETPKQSYEITYVLPEDIQEQLLLPEVVRRYCVEERDRFPVPKTPTGLSYRGLRIVSWVDKKSGASYTSAQLAALSPEKNMTLEAVVKK